MSVPFLDLHAQFRSIKDEVESTIAEVVDSCAFAGGRYVAAFEESFAEYCGRKFAIGVGSGTEALWLCLLALDIGPEDEVITVPNTFIATAEAISYTGAGPVFVDVRPDTALMDPERLEAAISNNTRAVIPVHLYGQTAEMDAIRTIAERHGIVVIEDASQAHGARYNGVTAGAMSLAGCFSFYPGKNLGAYGEAGAVVTDDEGYAERIRKLRDHGQSEKYHHDLIGWNCRMDGIQGAILSVKLRHLDSWNEARRIHAERYRAALDVLGSTVRPLAIPATNEHVHHVYVVRAEDRTSVIRELQEAAVGYGIHYPIPLHLTNAYAHLGLGPDSFPRAESLATEVLSLPMYPELTPSQIDAVIEAALGAPVTVD